MTHPSSRKPDPFERVLEMGSEAGSTAGVVGIVAAAMVHGAAILLTFAIPPDDAMINAAMATLVIDVVPEETPAPEPPPEPEPVAEIPPPPPPPPPPPKPAEPADPYEDIHTPPAEAAKILTAPAEPNEPPAPPEQGFASGNGDGLGFGMVAGAGEGNEATYDPRARVVKVVDKSPPSEPQKTPPATTERDLSRPASAVYGFTSECEFPDSANVDMAVVQVAVTVGTDGKAQRVEVVSDPGQGFGAAARVCAMTQPYRPARDKTGRLVVSKTPPFRIRFTR